MTGPISSVDFDSREGRRRSRRTRVAESEEASVDPREGSFRQVPLKVKRINQVRTWILVYFFLLLFEGVLRKWAVSNFLVSAVLLLVRDPVVVFIYYLAWRAGVFPKNKHGRVWALLTGLLCALGVAQLFVNGWLKPAVVLYGIRTYCLHVPLIFIMGRVLRREDVLRVGRWTLLIAAPMALLMVVQLFSPPDSFLNRATLGEGSTQIGLALGRIRPAGTFSYGTGATSFNLLLAAFLLYSFVEAEWVSARLRWIAGIALVMVVPISGSRTFVLSGGLLIGFALVGGRFKSRLRWVTLRAVGIGGAVFALLALTPFFREGMITFAQRWQEALGPSGSVNDSIVMRVAGEFVGAFNNLGATPLLGYGLGLGSNVGAALTTSGIGFLLAESEWERTVLEMGPVVAVLWLGVRSAFGVGLYRRSLACLRKGHPLAWLLLGTECVSIFNGITQQPTALGFLVFTTGLCLAAIKSAERADVPGAPESKKPFHQRRLDPVDPDRRGLANER